MRGVSLPTPIAERVLDLVARIPPGRVMAYGDVAAWFADGGPGADDSRPAEDEGADATDSATLGPRQVGRVMARYGGGVPWWRVLRSDGTHAPGLADEALRRLRAEGTPMRPGGTRVDMAKARWHGDAEARGGGMWPDSDPLGPGDD
ncbi:MGMT family protein [Yinghuangia sp. ASG 101]|uniref:MGMT family protein n=1 Tax=Yinghuangia sp. ASG 101 TaxID=2896848 RepID=UPI001E52A7A9|nr:MGMT family protein [Yinghuangia sp. ASG 101]UGQ14400.1 MGMT family protein [Yinghuangia sp. ASG 101]